MKNTGKMTLQTAEVKLPPLHIGLSKKTRHYKLTIDSPLNPLGKSDHYLTITPTGEISGIEKIYNLLCTNQPQILYHHPTHSLKSLNPNEFCLEERDHAPTKEEIEHESHLMALVLHRL